VPTHNHLNYQHLFYFHTVLMEGSLTAAAARLRLTHPTLSAQIRALEAALGGALFERRGRRLVATPLGVQVDGYAAEIFRLGAELVEVAQRRAPGKLGALRVGVVGNIPKSISLLLLEEALGAAGEAFVQVSEGTLARLGRELTAGRLNVVLADAVPEPTARNLRSHYLGAVDILLFGTRGLQQRHGKRFPTTLAGAPVVLPGPGSLRQSLQEWFTDRGLHVRTTGEFDDGAMVRAFGARGHGIFPVRRPLRAEVESTNDVVCLGTADGVVERYYAITPGSAVGNEGVATFLERAPKRLRQLRQGL
jgi:LysR family transcriptional activator of nhaA